MAGTPPPSSPSKPAAPVSVYAYQTRLLRGNASTASPATPSALPTLSRMGSLREDAISGLRRSGSGARIAHRAGKSIDLVRGQWEAKIEAAGQVEDEVTTPQPSSRPPRPRSMLVASSVFNASASSLSETPRPETAKRHSVTVSHETRPTTTSSVATTSPPPVEPVASAKRATAVPPPSALPEPATTRQEVAPTQPAVVSEPASNVVPPVSSDVPRLPSSTDFGPSFERHGRFPSLSTISSLTPNSTGASISSRRSAVDTLAEARANALRRREAKKKAGVAVPEAAVELPPIPEPKDLTPPPKIPAITPKTVEPPKESADVPKSDQHHALATPTPPAVPPFKAANPRKMQVWDTEPAEPPDKLKTPFGERLKPVTKDTASAEPLHTKPPASPFGERVRPTQRLDAKAEKPAETISKTTPGSKPPPSPFGERLRPLPPAETTQPSQVPPAVAATNVPALPSVPPSLGGASSSRPPASPFGERLRVAQPTETKAEITEQPITAAPSALERASSLFGERLRPTTTVAEPSCKDTFATTSATSTPFGERLRPTSQLATKTEKSDPPKPEPAPTLRKIKSLDVRSTAFNDRAKAPEQPVEVEPPAKPSGESAVLRKVRSIDLGPNKASEQTTAANPAPARLTADRLPTASTPTSTPKPKFAGLGYRAPTGPPKGNVSSLANRFATGGTSGPTPRGRIPSLSSDRRRLGKHLPRIVSGDQGWEGAAGSPRRPSTRIISSAQRKSSLSRIPASAEENTPPPAAKAETVPEPPTPTPRSASKTEPLAPSATVNANTDATPLSRKSSVLGQKSSKSNLLGALTPRAEVAGEEMKGLMSAIGAASARKPEADNGEGVTGMSNRLRLSRLPLPASSATLAPAPLPSRKLVTNNNWMDKQRHALAAYEYLCHIGEAQQWIEGCLDEELEFGVTEMEEGLRDGVVLAKLARVFQGEHIVRRIWTEAKHRYRQSDNINYYLAFVRTVGMPETFIFELTDLYNKKNIPKVIFCIHVLSHLLARLGRAERMNNLVGQFEFTDEQLAATQKGIQGVAMPNFKQVGQTLAMEAAWEPEEEEEEETEDEKRDRELLECEDSITSLQCHLRGMIARQRTSRVKTQLKLAAPIVTRLQAQVRGASSRRAAINEKQSHAQLAGWASALQAASRTHLAAARWNRHVGAVRGTEGPIIGVQAYARGLLARRRRKQQRKELERATYSVIGLQAAARGCLARRDRKEERAALATPQAAHAITSVQAILRGRLTRQAAAKEQKVVQAHAPIFTSMQSHLRGALIRRRHKAREEKMGDATSYIVAIQSQARGALARRRKQGFTRNVAKVTTQVTSLQALARARLAKRTHESMQKALAKVEVAGSVGGLQAFLRTRLAKKHTVEQKKELEFVQPDVIGFQAVARGFIQRRDHFAWVAHLHDPGTQQALVYFQSVIRGFLVRREFWLRQVYLRANQDKIVKAQAMWRGRQQRQMYQRLITGFGVDIPTIQNYMFLLDDTETDFRDQLRIDTLRKEVVELLRTNQTLETEVGELDTKIALILKNKMTFEDLARAKRRHWGAAAPADEAFHPPGGGDPFVGVHLDRTSQRKLELFEHLFFTLQTEPKYLCRLLHKLAVDPNLDKDRRLVEAVTLILFGFGHDQRDEYLFHKLCQLSVQDQILRSRSVEELAASRFAIIPVATQFVKPSLTPYLQNLLGEHVQRVIQADELDLSTDPVEMYNRLINAEESLTGVKSALPRDLDADQVLQSHVETRTLYIQHLQELRNLADLLTKSIMASTAQLPYTVRMLARESLLALRVRYRDYSDSELWPVIARGVVLPFILPALVAPETYGIAASVNPIQRRNLTAIAGLLGHVATQDLNNMKDRLVTVPLAEYIRAEGRSMQDWVLDVAEVDFFVQEMLESTSDAKPISITRTDIYSLLTVLMHNIPALTASKSGDPIESVLSELEGPPLDYDKSKTTVRVRLTNRLAQLKTSDPVLAQLREMEVQAKRHVLAVLRVQTGRNLYEVFLNHPTEEDEQRWIYEVHRDIALEQARLARHDLPPTPAETEYQMESIRSLPYHEVKSRAIEFCMRLVEAGRLSREDQFAGLLESIAGDIREKHRLRKKRKVDLGAMHEAHTQLTQKRDQFEEQIQSYHDYIDSAMAALQQKKKAPFMSKQYWHQRGSGKKSKFGSYKYTAADLYEKGILLSVNGFSPRQFDKIYIFIGSNDVGVFTVEMKDLSASSASNHREEIRMEDLLQAQFDNNVRLDLFDGLAAFNLNMLIHQINKKFYAS